MIESSARTAIDSRLKENNRNSMFFMIFLEFLMPSQGARAKRASRGAAAFAAEHSLGSCYVFLCNHSRFTIIKNSPDEANNSQPDGSGLVNRKTRLYVRYISHTEKSDWRLHFNSARYPENFGVNENVSGRRNDSNSTILPRTDSRLSFSAKRELKITLFSTISALVLIISFVSESSSTAPFVVH